MRNDTRYKNWMDVTTYPCTNIMISGKGTQRKNNRRTWGNSNYVQNSSWNSGAYVENKKLKLSQFTGRNNFNTRWDVSKLRFRLSRRSIPVTADKTLSRLLHFNVNPTWNRALGPVSISEKTSFRKISSSLEAARFVFRIVRSLWNLTGTSAAVLPMCLSNFKTIR